MIRIDETTIINAPIGRCFDLARSVEVHLEGNVHWGEQAVASGGVTSGLVGLRGRVTWRAKHFGVWQKLTSEIDAMNSPVYFRDVMISGPFRSMSHDHHFRSLDDMTTEMRDVFCFAAPVPILGRIVEVSFLGRYMRALLHERNQAIKEIAESREWKCYLPQIPDTRGELLRSRPR